MDKKNRKECEAIVLQAMEAIQERDEETFSQILYPIQKKEWKKETGDTAFPTAQRFRAALSEIKPYGFTLPYKIEMIYETEEYYGRNWYEESQISVEAAADVSVYWSATEKRTLCSAWPVTFQCLNINGTWYLNPYWLWEYLRD